MSQPSENPEQLTFEAALQQLEAVVRSMESGSLPLNDLVSRYEQGITLLKKCEGQLKEAELRVELLRKDKDLANTEPFEVQS